MAITTMAMVATVFVLNLYGMKEKPVPVWAKKVFVIYLARILCMCNCLSAQEARSSSTKDTELGGRPRTKHKYKLVTTQEPTAASSHDDSHDDRSRGDPPTPRPRERRHSDSRSAHPFLERNLSNDSKTKAKPDYAKEWLHVAAVCDRLFFWLCLLFICITTLILFHPITTSRFFKLPLLDRKGFWQWRFLMLLWVHNRQGCGCAQELFIGHFWQNVIVHVWPSNELSKTD